MVCGITNKCSPWNSTVTNINEDVTQTENQREVMTPKTQPQDLLEKGQVSSTACDLSFALKLPTPTNCTMSAVAISSPKDQLLVPTYPKTTTEIVSFLNNLGLSGTKQFSAVNTLTALGNNEAAKEAFFKILENPAFLKSSPATQNT